MELFIRRNGEIIPIESYNHSRYPYFRQLIEFNKNVINSMLSRSNLEVEINFVEFPTLGDELILDERINNNKIEPDREELNQRRGVAIKVDDDQVDYNQILLESYRDKKICYISLVEDYDIFDVIISELHEIYHFNDPFPTNIDFIPIDFRDPSELQRRMIEHHVRHLLNDYFANYRAYFCLREILQFFNMEQYDCRRFINQSFSNINHLFYLLNEKIKVLKENRDSSRRIQKDFSGSLIDLFLDIAKIIGMWHALNELLNINLEVTESGWSRFMQRIGDDISGVLKNFLNTLKRDLSPHLIDNPGLEHFYNLYINFFDNEFLNVFNSIISS